jgi:pilus assembly protein Flp/PilA
MVGVECIHELQGVGFVNSLVAQNTRFPGAHAVIGRSWGVADGFNLCLELDMKKFLSVTRRFLRDEEGVTAIEYGLIAALIAIVIIGAVTAVGGNLTLVFQAVADALAAVVPD